MNGTSVASPWVAGVAALIWAADPAQSADEVATTLDSYVHLPPAWMEQTRWVAARNAVLGTLGGTASARITVPEASADVPWGLPVDLEARLEVETFRSAEASCALRWSSDVSGTLVERTVTLPASRVYRPAEYVARDRVTTLQQGVQLLRFDADCTAGATALHAAATQPIRVLNSAPVVGIDAPAPGATACAGQAVLLRGHATDVNQPLGLPDSAFEWRSTRGGFIGYGPSRMTSTLPVGAQSIVLRVTDDGGLTTPASVPLTVLAATDPACSNTPPTAHIVSPADGAIFDATGHDGEWFIEVDLVGTGSDLETPPAGLSYRWSTDRVEGLLGTGATRRVRLHTVGGVRTTHTVTLRVTDGAGNWAEDRVHITIDVFY